MSIDLDKVQIDYLTKIFVEMRLAWFNSQLKSNAHERDWETEEREQDRVDNNKIMKDAYDGQTTLIVSGDKRPSLTPRCSNDLWYD